MVVNCTAMPDILSIFSARLTCDAVSMQVFGQQLTQREGHTGQWSAHSPVSAATKVQVSTEIGYTIILLLWPGASQHQGCHSCLPLEVLDRGHACCSAQCSSDLTGIDALCGNKVRHAGSDRPLGSSGCLSERLRCEGRQPSHAAHLRGEVGKNSLVRCGHKDDKEQDCDANPGEDGLLCGEDIPHHILAQGLWALRESEACRWSFTSSSRLWLRTIPCQLISVNSELASVGFPHLRCTGCLSFPDLIG